MIVSYPNPHPPGHPPPPSHSLFTNKHSHACFMSPILFHFFLLYFPFPFSLSQSLTASPPLPLFPTGGNRAGIIYADILMSVYEDIALKHDQYMSVLRTCYGQLYYSLIHSFTHPFTHSLIHSLIHSFIHSLTHSFIHSLIHSFTCLFIFNTHNNYTL